MTYRSNTLEGLQVEGWNGGEAKSTQGTRRMGPRQWNLVGAGTWQTRERITGSSLRVNVFLGYHSNGDGKPLQIRQIGAQRKERKARRGEAARRTAHPFKKTKPERVGHPERPNALRVIHPPGVRRGACGIDFCQCVAVVVKSVPGRT